MRAVLGMAWGYLVRLAIPVPVMVLCAVGPARGAIAGAPQPTTTNHPDLVSVQVLAGPQNRARFCFDKVLQSPGPAGYGTPANFSLGGYDAGTYTSQTPGRFAATAAFLDPAGTKCALVEFRGQPITNAGQADYTFGSVIGGTVAPNGLGGVASDGNFGDSVPITGSTSVSGSGGHTTAPDLVAVRVSPSSNALDFIFDQNVDPRVIVPNNFFFVDRSANSVVGARTPTPLVIGGNDIRIGFPSSVANAVVAGTVGGGSFSAAGDPETGSPAAAQAVAGKSGATPRPRVIGAKIVGSDQVDYTFDQKIALVPGRASNAVLYTANASPVHGVSEAVTNPQTLRVRFPASAAGIVDQFTYAAVGGTPINGAAVVTSVKGVANIAGGAAVGGNAGALAAGFTSGPDARSATFDNGADAVTVDFDQRIDPSLVIPDDFVLRAKDGVALGAPAATRVVQNPLIPGDARVILEYTPGTVRLASILEIHGPPNATTSPLDPITAAPSAVRTFAGPGVAPIPNIQQILGGRPG